MNKISIIIPYFRNFIFFKKTLKSILNQSYQNYEIIIVYDDPEKKELFVLKKLIANKKKIKLFINKRNIGAGLSRNKGAKMAKGKYLAFIDSDDIWKQNKLKLQTKFMKKFNLKISHTSYLIINDIGKIIGKRKAKHVQTYSNLINSCDIGLSTVIVEKKLFLRNKFASNITKEDYVSWLKISKKISIYGLDKYLVLWRKTQGSLSSNYYQKIFDAFDIYYKKEKFGFVKSLFYVLVLSTNYFLKKYL